MKKTLYLITILFLTSFFYSCESQTLSTKYGSIYFSETFIDSSKTPILIAELDSIQYLSDVIIFDNKTYVVGYKFTGSNTRFSQIVCIDHSSNQIDWKKTINHYEMVELGRISIIDDYIYVTGAGGKHGVEKDSTGTVIADHVDLNAIIIRFKPNGGEFKIKEIKNDNPTNLISPIIKHHNAFYISYSVVDSKDYRRVINTKNKIFKLNENLDPIREKVYSNRGLSGSNSNLISFNGLIYLVGSEYDGARQFISSYSFNNKLDFSKTELSKNKYEYKYTLQKSDKDVRITAYGKKRDKETPSKYDFKSQVISTYSLSDGNWDVKHLFEFNLDSTFHLIDYYAPLSSNRNGVYAIGIQNKKQQFICKIEKGGVKILEKFQIPKQSKIRRLFVDRTNIFLVVSKEHGWSNRLKDKILIYKIP